MLEVIQDVLGAEKRAGEIVEEARQKAAKIKATISEEETTNIRAAEAQAEQRLRDAVASAREEADRRVAQAQKEYREREQEFDPSDDERFAAAVDQVVALVRLGPTAESEAGTDQVGGAS